MGRVGWIFRKVKECRLVRLCTSTGVQEPGGNGRSPATAWGSGSGSGSSRPGRNAGEDRPEPIMMPHWGIGWRGPAGPKDQSFPQPGPSALGSRATRSRRGLKGRPLGSDEPGPRRRERKDWPVGSRENCLILPPVPLALAGRRDGLSGRNAQPVRRPVSLTRRSGRTDTASIDAVCVEPSKGNCRGAPDRASALSTRHPLDPESSSPGSQVPP